MTTAGIIVGIDRLTLIYVMSELNSHLGPFQTEPLYFILLDFILFNK